MKLTKLFKLYSQERLLGQSSIQNYKSLLNVFSRDTGIYDLEIIHNDIIVWRNKVLKRASITTFNTYLRQMKALFNFAVEYDYLLKSPFKRIKTIPNYKQQPKTVDDNLIKLAITLCKDTQIIKYGWFWSVVIQTLYSTGMRRRQLVELKWSDFNSEKSLLKLSAEGSKTKREYFVPINKDVFNGILKIKANSPTTIPEEQIFNIALVGNNFKSNKMTCGNVSSFFQKLSKELGVQISAHRLRHTMATKIANNGGNVKIVQAMLGHTNISTTLQYLHPDMDRLRQAQELLNL